MNKNVPVCPNCGSTEASFKKKAAQWECNDCEQRFSAPGDATSRPQRIFLSYGHDENTPLVQALHDRLVAAGHAVWIDQAQIKVGDDWRLAIKKGLMESDRVLSFLSKHSTRDPGVCLDEIGIALAHRHGAIATLLVEPIKEVSPPPSIAHIQYLDLSKWRDEHAHGDAHWCAWLSAQTAILLDIVSRNAGFAGEMDELQKRLTPLSHGSRLGSLIERGFIGRSWLFDEIEAWRNQTEERTFWLTAEPGMGKSAIAAQLAHTAARYTVAYHFCRFDEPSTRSPETFVCTLAFQLAARLPGYRQLLLHASRYPSNPLAELQADDLFTLLLANPLRHSIDGGQSADRLLVIVDALDEAPAIANLLARRQSELPVWIALLVTSRTDPQIRSALAGVVPHELKNDDPRNHADLMAFIDNWFATPKVSPPHKARETLLTCSEGNLLYLVTARAGVSNGSFNLDTPSAYPSGLAGLYRQWFDRQFGGDGQSTLWHDVYDLLELICASPEPLPLSVARKTLKWVGQDKIASTRPLGSLIQEHDGTLELFHRSLSEWLQDTALADIYWINAEEGRIRIAQTLWGQLSDLNTATAPVFGHRVLPGLLLATAPNRRQEIWGNDDQRFELIKQFDDALEKFSAHKIRLALLDLRKVHAQECQIHLGEESEETLRVQSGLASSLQEIVSDFKQSRQITESVLAIRERVRGPEHPDTSTSLNNLAGTLGMLGDYAGARALYERALAIREHVLGPAHPATALSLGNLAYHLDTLGDYAGARPLYERALAIREATIGPEHPETATTLNNLACMLEMLNDSAGARQFHERALAIREASLGPDHPETGTSLNNLANLLHTLGDYAGARTLYERALAINEAALGPEHSETATTLNNLACHMDTMGDYASSRKMHERALTISEAFLGPVHPDTAICLGNLAGVLKKLGDYDDARPLYERALAIFEAALGSEHPYTLTAMQSFAVFLRDHGHSAQAEPLLREVLARQLRLQGSDGLEVASALSALGALLGLKGDRGEAETCLRRALLIREQALGFDHGATHLVRERLDELLGDEAKQ